jgi:hypothetical protein
LSTSNWILQGYLRMMRVFHDFYIWLDPLICRSMPLLGHHAHGFTYTPRAPMFARDISDLEPRCPEQETSTSTCARSGSNCRSILLARLPVRCMWWRARFLAVQGWIAAREVFCNLMVAQAGPIGSGAATMRGTAGWPQDRSIDQVWLSQGSGDLMADSAMRVFADLLERFEREGVAGSAGLEAAQ